MPDCDYCTDSFDSEEEYLTHLQTDHEGELTRIDQKRVESVSADDDGLGIEPGPVIIAGVFLIAAAAVGAILLPLGGSADEPHSRGSVHDHGTMEIVIDGEQLGLNTNPQFVRADENFHFHGDEQQRYGAYVWHIHAQDVSLQYALDTLGIEVDDKGTELVYDGTTYDAEDPGTQIRIEVNGQSVDPGEHMLSGPTPMDQAAAGEGDDVRIVVETDG